LLHREIKEIESVVSDKNIAIAIANMRSGKVKVKPGYDGIFGFVEVILPEQKINKK
jgi:PHP family Zn ribbon phosphoesterase